MACPPAALGQEASPQIQGGSGPLQAPSRQNDTKDPKDPTEDSTEDSTEEPTEGTDSEPGRPRVLHRIAPQSMTPEQTEEAERLRKLGAKYGTDPTAIVGRVQLSGEYQDFPQAAKGAAAIVRVDLPFRGNYLLRVDTPVIAWSDPNRSGTDSVQGFSDLAVTAGWRVYNTPEYAVLIGAVSKFPTATETGLGLGKYTIGPSIATARFVRKLDSFLVGLFTQQMSIGGDSARSSVNVSEGTLQVNTFWGERGWSIVHANWRVDWERNAKSSMVLELEAGRNVAGKLGVFIRPGIGIWGQDLPGAYSWNVSGGIRYMFRSF